ncbi:cupin domain-containing protein [Ensifer adhaerens]|uniref:Cupin domain-containing protein n=1 Tax=Ensifer adhaerens TaxID=106592 RepID=A0A9Q8YH43_ENSAD|nr:cupin domain-containing protein [Ensifer adhaerens]USJ28426.1 cupin domain-containing protein [Ensifer adhaerens]
MTQTASAAILRQREQPIANRGGGASTIPLVTPANGARQLINGITRLEPGKQIPLHFHNCEESVLLLEGQAVAVIDGVEYPLEPGDTTWIPANLPHFFRNVSQTEVMRIFWTYASIEATRTLVETGATHPVAAEHTKDKLIQR